MKNPNGPSVEDVGEWADALMDKEAERLLGAARCCDARATLLKLASHLEACAETLDDRDVVGGEWGNLQHDVEILRMAERIMGREAHHNARTEERGDKAT